MGALGFDFLPFFLVFDFLDHILQHLGVTSSYTFSNYSGSAERALWVARNQTWVSLFKPNTLPIGFSGPSSGFLISFSI